MVLLLRHRLAVQAMMNDADLMMVMLHRLMQVVVLIVDPMLTMLHRLVQMMLMMAADLILLVFHMLMQSEMLLVLHRHLNMVVVVVVHRRLCRYLLGRPALDNQSRACLPCLVCRAHSRRTWGH